MNKVDVAICAYGKPWHSAVALFSLFEHSGNHIDRIFFHEEPKHPHGDSVSFIFPWFADRIIHYKPPLYLDWHGDRNRIYEEQYRMSIRYQYAWENTDKDYLFIFHNDCLFTSDIIGGMLERLENQVYSGVGQIGQCWNCSAFYDKVCDGNRYEQYKPTYQQLVELITRVPSPRTKVKDLSPAAPWPLPECRLNEFACLINLKKTRDLVLPKGDIPPIGLMGHDTGTDWFRGLSQRGHHFLNWHEGMTHAWVVPERNGHSLDECADDHYYSIEAKAKEYCLEHYKDKMVQK